MMGTVTSRTLRRLLTIVLACIFASGGPVRAQSPGDQTQPQIGITAEVFGLGGIIREGEWAAVRLVLTDLGDRPRAVAVRLHLPDPDGDTALMQRTVTLNPGLAQGVWLYGLMPWGIDRTAYTVTVHEFDVNSSGEALDDGVGAQLAAERVTPLAMLAASRPVMAVLGSSPAGGLGLYESSGPQGQDTPSTSHELPRLLVDLTPDSIPDRWMGLAMVESLFWFAGEPSALSESQAQALREWVYRGGHLIVSIPSAGQSWTNPRANPIQDILPAVEVRRIDGVDLTAHAMLLQPRGDGIALPTNATIHALYPAENPAPGEADVILNSLDGEPMVVRRALGAGLVTLVGYDMNDRRLGARVDAQYFWHRVLGKRFETLSRDRIRELQQSGQASFNLYNPSRLDTDIGPEIAKQGRAGVGVLLGLAVFALYLVVAGPGGFGLLKLKRATQHAWVAFVACIIAFAAIAWGGAAALRPTRAEVQHLTFLDHVFGQQEQHARLWFSALLPDYGEALIALGTADDRRAWTQALAAWADASSTGGRPFPDTRGYVVDARDPSQFVVPTRSTVKQFRGDWLGRSTIGVPVPVGGPLSVQDESGSTRLRGVVSHSLPGPLEDVTILVVRGQKPLRGDLGPIGSGPLFGRIAAARLTDDWAPDTPIDFEQIPSNAWDTGERYFERLVDVLSRGINTFGGAPAIPDHRDAATRLEAISWHASLKPPDFTSTAGNQQRLLQRWESHGLDLSAWLTQPCVIIVGHLMNSPSPAPVFINEREAPSSGRTLVRWVYPLPPEPPTVPETIAPANAGE